LLEGSLDAFAWSFLAGPVLAAALWPLEGGQKKKAFWFGWAAFILGWLFWTAFLSNLIPRMPTFYRDLYGLWRASRPLSRLTAMACLPIFLGLTLDLASPRPGWKRTGLGFWVGLGFAPILAGSSYPPDLAWTLVVTACLLSLFASLIMDGSWQKETAVGGACRVLLAFHLLGLLEPGFGPWGIPAWSGPSLRLLALAFLPSPGPGRGLRGLSAAGLGIGGALAAKFWGAGDSTQIMAAMAGIGLGWLVFGFSGWGLVQLLGLVLAWRALSLGFPRASLILLSPRFRDLLWTPLLLAAVAWRPIPSPSLPQATPQREGTEHA
jgi:hypothetical protein